jgi:RecB family exonuclease
MPVNSPPAGTLSNISRSKPFVPSKLSVYMQCPLRYLLETELAGGCCLPLGPPAIRGTAIHEVVARFQGQEEVAGLVIMDELVSRIARLLDADPAAAPLMHLASKEHGVEGVLLMDELVTACQLVRVALRQGAAAPSPASTRGRTRSTIGIRKFGIEIPLAAPGLDMAGRVDRLSLAPDGTILVTEFKSGHAFEKDGTPKLAVLMQLAAYGVMAKEKYRPKSVALEIIAPGQHWSAPMERGIEGPARELLATMAKDIPRNTPLDTLALSRAGPHCWNCRTRPSCQRYSDALYGASAGTSLVVSNRDIAGTVLETGGDQNYRMIRVKKRSGITARITGVPAALYPAFAAGRPLVAYSLGVHDIQGKASEPTNFFMVQPDVPQLSAFESMLLAGTWF